MKTTLLTLALLFCSWLHTAHAQFVNIPDAKFRQYLQQTYPQCMNGNQLDTTCSAVVNATEVNVAMLTIFDLTGIQYFDKLEKLISYNNQLTTLPSLSNTVTYIDCSNNFITQLPELPNNLGIFYCDNNKLTSLPALPPLLGYIYCTFNKLNELPTLPTSLKYIDCGNNDIATIPTLPDGLVHLICYDNLVSTIPTLPNSLESLNCDNNQLASLPELPEGLVKLFCANNQITNLPTLPNSVCDLGIIENPLNCIPNLPLCANFVCDMQPIAICSTSTDTEINKSTNQFEIYPNPAATHITLKYPDLPHTATLQITDPLGKTVLQQNLERPEQTIAVGHLSPGLYMVKIMSNDQRTYTQKLIINH